MLHDGRFLQTTKLDAVIVSLPRNTMILENPESAKPIEPWLHRKLLLLPRLNIEYSYLNWPVRNLKQRIELQRETLTALGKEAIYNW